MSAYYLVQTLSIQQMFYAEIRFAPQQHTKCGLTQREAVLAVCDGLERAKQDFPDIDTGLLCCLMHKGENAHVNEKENFETVEVVRELLSDRVLGLDLAGYENTGDFLLYAPLFEKAHSSWYSLYNPCRRDGRRSPCYGRACDEGEPDRTWN